MLVTFLLLIFTVIIWFELPKLIKNKMWGELIAFSILMLIGMSLSIAQTVGINLPNPTKGLEALYKPLAELLKS